MSLYSACYLATYLRVTLYFSCKCNDEKLRFSPKRRPPSINGPCLLLLCFPLSLFPFFTLRLCLYMFGLWAIAILLAGIAGAQAQLGAVQTNVPWRAGHVAVFLDPYVILYGGSENISESYPDTVYGSTGLWIWDSRNGSWYNMQSIVQSNMLPQVYFGATTLPSSGQMIVVAGNTTAGGASGMLQKLDTNSWSWSFPSSSSSTPTLASQFAIATVNNTIYVYGGTSVGLTGLPQNGAVLNSLYMLDGNSFGWTSGSNGAAITGHSTCYIKACNCLVVFGGTSTGSGNAASAGVIVYDLTTRGWNLQAKVAPSASGTPGARVLHTATCLDDTMIVYGGGTTQPFDSDVWVLNATNYPLFSWARIDMNNRTESPGTRMGHTAALDKANQKVYIFGGWGGSATNDSNMYILDITAWSWTRVPTTGFHSIISPSSPSPSVHDDSSPGSIIGPAVGGAVGGTIGLVLIAAVFFFWKRHRNQAAKDSASEKTDEYYVRHPGYHNNEDRNFHGSSYDLAEQSNIPGMHNRKRASKAMTTSTGYRDSFMLRSELGDTDRVMTGVLEEINPPSDTTSDNMNYSNNTRSFRDSTHTSKAHLLPDTEPRSPLISDYVFAQKPNEISAHTSRFGVQDNGRSLAANVPIEHYSAQNPASITASVGAPLSSSMEVLRSIQTNTDNSLSHTATQAMKYRDGVQVTHATHNAREVLPSANHDEDNTTFTESVSYQAQVPAGPIQYIPPSSRHFSLGTTTTASGSGMTNINNNRGSSAVPLTHHQYPSSNMSSVPIARPITPEPENSGGNRVSTQHFQPLGHGQEENIYETISPLEMLAALGHASEVDRNSQSDTDTNEMQAGSTSSSVPVPPPQQVGGLPVPSASEDPFRELRALINILPRRYKLDTTKGPIIGPMNSVFFVSKVEDSQRESKMAIKSYGRREAWERECRTLSKLKSAYVVDLLEVLTIQDESDTSLLQYRHSTGDSTSSNNSGSVVPDEEDKVRYVTVLELLDETLVSAIRKARSEKYAWTREQTRAIARNVVECLAWCHSRGIAFCDLKPSNIMHRVGSPWKLIDFEASRTIGEECVGVITPRYCPPEVARATTYGLEGANGVVATPSVDLWALGCVIYELETKHALFASTIKDETILHFVSHPSPSTPILNNGLRWNEHKELYIPHMERKIPDSRSRQLIKMLLSREPSKRGNASTLLEHPYFQS
ncbi:hypothetical protein BX666DRAFT_1884869 [Dichotomocladium elegans]|nr:hypothetical protein BX666DRAFT_1884869 [Dichotomocladium elegans]